MSGCNIDDLPPYCTDQCKSTKHGDIITSAISKRSICDLDLCAFLAYTCSRCESVRDTFGRTALHVAASCGRVELAKWLIRNRRAEINARDKESGYTPLHRSIFYGKIHVAVELIKLGASCNELDNDSLTVLEHAMKDGLKPEHNFGGELYSWGSNTNNVLGPQQARENAEFLDVFHKQYPNESVQQICIDQFHSIIVTTSGKVLSCGHGQGGRLGLGMEKTVVVPHIINFPDSQKGGESVTCIQASISREHSIFLCSDGNVYTCGLNTNFVLGLSPPPEQQLVPKAVRHLSTEIIGVCAGRYHSVAWGPKAFYTWGLNAGQLGHKVNNRLEERYILTPKMVKTINLEDVNIGALAVSNGATAVCTEKGDIYVLHEFLCRKIASRQLNAVNISIIGGKLESPTFNKEMKKNPGKELKVAVLTNTGNILLWQESDQQLCRCIFSINRAFVVKQVTININDILFVTDYGEAFKGAIVPRKKKYSLGNVSKPQKNFEKSAFHKFLEKEDCVLIRLKKVSKIHRAISIQSDSRGKDFCVIQAHPYKRFVFGEIETSEMQTNLQTLMNDADESDDIHDVVFNVGHKYFPAHRYIVASKSPYLEKLTRDKDKDVVVLDNINPDIFEQFLIYVYTGSCELTKCGQIKNETLRNLCNEPNKPKEKEESIDDKETLSNISAYEYYSKVKPNQDQKQKKSNSRNPVRMLHEIAKTFECNDLLKILKNLEVHKYSIQMKNSNDTLDGILPLKYERKDFPHLLDVTIKCDDDKELRAHKCILAARLEYFSNMFSIRWKMDEEVSEVKLPFNRSVTDALLEYLYTDSLSCLKNTEMDHLFKILVLADQLFVTRLKEQCELLLAKLLTVKNAVQILYFSYLYNAQKLKDYCMKFIVLNFAAFLESRSLNDLDEDLLQELTEFYFQEKEEVWCRVITPYSTAVSDDEIMAISKTHPISLDEDVENVSKKPVQKRQTRTLKLSLSEKNSSSFIKHDGSWNNSVSDVISKSNNENESSTKLQSMLKNVDITKMDSNSVSSDFTKIDNGIGSRLKSITLATEKIKSEEVQPHYTRLSGSFTSAGSFNDSSEFPLLNSPPRHISGNVVHMANSPRVDTKHKIVRLSQKQRKKLSESSDNQTNPIAESPKNPWNIIPDLSSPICSPETKQSIDNIISDEIRQKGNLVKITSKLMVCTQMEDRAIVDLHKFYNSENVTDEIILIERVAIGAIASPVWVPKTK